jgi:YHS domain-containing protein
MSELVEFIVLVVFIIGVVRKVLSLFRPTQTNVRTSGATPSNPRSSATHQAEMVRDPVCGIFVSTELPHQLRHGKDLLHFCSRECLEKFQKESAHVAS